MPAPRLGTGTLSFCAVMARKLPPPYGGAPDSISCSTQPSA